MRYLLVIVVTAVLVAGGMFYWQQSQDTGTAGSAQWGPGSPGGFGGQRSPPLVAVKKVQREQLYDTIESIGTVYANEFVTLTAQVTETVRTINFEDGDFVEAGAVLVQLTNHEEEALLAEARANLDDAESQLARVENLMKQSLVSESEFDIARSHAEASKARLDTVLARLSDRLIRAPFSGILGFRQVSPGTLLAPNTPITTLDDISIMKLDFTVPETFLSTMKPGATVLARSASYPDREFEGVVRTVGTRVDPVTRAFQVRALIPNDDHALRPGMLMMIEIVMAERTALVVSENAVYQIQDRAYVFVLDSEMTVHETEIKTGTRRYGSVEVLGGLQEGDQIVTEGIVKLRDGMRVRLATSIPSPGTYTNNSG